MSKKGWTKRSILASKIKSHNLYLLLSGKHIGPFHSKTIRRLKLNVAQLRYDETFWGKYLLIIKLFLLALVSTIPKIPQPDFYQNRVGNMLKGILNNGITFIINNLCEYWVHAFT